jgi:O-antigen/teichoic acid export membrane protein
MSDPLSAESLPPPGLTSRVVRGSMWHLTGQGVTMLATLVATPFVIRLLGPQQYGIVAFVNVLIGYLSFADMGMGTASTRFGSLAHARGNDEEEATAIWSALLLAVVPAAIVSIALAVSARPLIEHGLRLPAYLHEPAIACVRLAALGFLARAIAGVLNTPATVRLRMDLVVLVIAGTNTGQILLVPLVVYIGGGVTGAVSVITGAAIAAALLHAIIGFRLLPALRRPHISRAVVRSLAGFGGGLMLSLIASTILANVEKLLLPRYASVEALAFYSVAFTLAFMLTQLPLAIMQSLLPAFSRLHANPDRSDFELLYRRGLHAMLFWALPGALFICIAARPFLTLWAGPQYGLESTLPVYLLIGGIVCEILAYVPGGVLITLGRTDIIARCQLSLLVPYVAGSAFLIIHFGAAGAAVAWSLRALANLLLSVYFAGRFSGFEFVPWPDNRRDFALSVAVLVLPVVVTALLTTSAIARAGVACAAIAAYGILLLTRVLSGEERSALRRMVPF